VFTIKKLNNEVAMKFFFSLISINILFILSSHLAISNENLKLGFLVIAEDRGSLGNKDTRNLFKSFSKEYTADLVFIGRKYNGIDSEYSDQIKNSFLKFNSEKISKIIVLPLFLSSSNHILKKIKSNLSAYNNDNYEIEWISTMSKNYMIAQILLDRVNSISRDPENERLVVLGMGAVDEDSEKLIRREYEHLIEYVQLRKNFKDVQVGIYYDYGVERKLRNKKNKEVDDIVIRTAAKKGKALLIPFLIGPKYSHFMSMTYWIKNKFDEFDIKLSREDIIKHPNISIWMKKMANIKTFNEKSLVGIVVMAHGATVPYNTALEKVIKPLRKKYLVEMAYGMGDSFAIQDAITTLEEKGVKGIIFVRMYAMSNQFKDKTDYILGLSKNLIDNYKDVFYVDEVPHQIRNSSIIKTFGGYEEDPLISEIYFDRIKKISRDPSKETIILLAHGAKTDAADTAWRRVMQNHLDQIQKNTNTPFKKVIALTLREDWPEKRIKAVEEIKKEIELSNKSGRSIIISDRLYGSAPYMHFLKGINFDINPKGLAPHPNLTAWLEKNIERIIKKEFSQQLLHEIARVN
jgi:sirohydrochlorin ferrochelatase